MLGDGQGAQSVRIRREGIDHDDAQVGLVGWRTVEAGQSVRRAHAGRSAGADRDPQRFKPKIATVDRGYKNVAIDGVKVCHAGLRHSIMRGLRAKIRRRSAIEPVIGHMKADAKLDRNWPNGLLNDAAHATLRGTSPTCG